MHVGVQVLIRHSCSSSPVQACKQGSLFLFLALAAFLSPAVPFMFHHCSCYKESSPWTKLELVEANYSLKIPSQKTEASFIAVYKLAQVLELCLHDWHQVTEMCVLCSTGPPLHNQLWMVWHLEFTYLKPLNKTWVTLKRAAATLQPQSSILPL